MFCSESTVKYDVFARVSETDSVSGSRLPAWSVFTQAYGVVTHCGAKAFGIVCIEAVGDREPEHHGDYESVMGLECRCDGWG